MFCQLVYGSVSPRPVGLPQLASIVHQAVGRNRLTGITGLLCASRQHYLQLLEGGRTAVSETFLCISRDPRHERVTLLVVRDVTSRQFEEWHMGYVGDAELTARGISFEGGFGRLRDTAVLRHLADLRPGIEQHTRRLLALAP